ncbi:MAG: O-methyltransferase, partial [Ignavibacteriae bacterium]|nr:O-methyltransferase [Ignavibacteriota bacterium]
MSNILFNEQFDYLQSNLINNNPLLTEMEEFANHNNIPILEQISANFLEQLVRIYKPKSFLEIGTAIGYSTIRVSKISNNQTIIDTIELSKDSIKLAKKFFDKSGEQNKINLIEGNALNIIPTLQNKYDFIFIDSDKKDYEELLYTSFEKLEKGGIILVDNLLWKGFIASKNVPENYKTSTEIIRKFNKLFLNFPGL